MNREIKFRAWDGKSKKFTTPYNKEIIGSSTNGELKWELKGVGSDADVIFMQYTGLKDKNGKEIYEGDIVRWEISNQTVINEIRWGFKDDKYEFSQFGLFGKRQQKRWEDDSEYTWQGLNKYVSKCCEVIGNIYENKELLK